MAVIFGTPGPTLTADQRAFFRDANPLGLILFKRNCETPDQLRRLTEDFRAAVGRADAPILIDHEGGTHQRMDPPVWPQFPAPARFGALYAHDPAAALAAARLNGRAIGTLLSQHGITVDCAPLLDVPVAGADPVIGDRAFSSDPEEVALLADAFVEGMKAAGVTPIIKHIPGHGRAMVDSHKELPTVAAPLAELDHTDFVPFRRLASAPWAMVAHILFPDIDAKRPATISPLVIEQLIRGRLGFEGVLISDCIYMEALGGSLAERCRAVLASGIDIALSSHGDVEEWQAIAAAARPLTDAATARLAANRVPPPALPPLDVAETVGEIMRQLAA
ncbi:glycosyl hydrolase [Aliidongia dinghuensis]|uniref:beta-N-acetylhexosaminidase n=1 Tax=Aliidongia dinghuensis TaxID=1867774 RepID=A0A8J2YWH9_9PROT|nr:glycosyl hydrolase [Aliidongia dinghuensis]